MKNKYFLAKNFAYYRYKDIYFCFNSLTGAYLLLAKSTYDWLRKITTKKIKKKIVSNKKEKEILKLLLSNDILSFNEKGDKILKKVSERKELYEKKLKKEKIINFIGFCVTDNCNFKCSYCMKRKYSLLQKDNVKNVLKWSIAKKRLDEFFKIILNNKTKTATIAFGGGEPLLQFGLIRKIVNYSNKIKKRINTKITFNITTNGSLINNEIAKFIALNKFDVGLSMDGTKEVNDISRKYTNNLGTFDDIFNGLKLLIKNVDKKKITISTVIFSKNIGLIKNDFLEFIKKLGIKKVCIESDIVNSINKNKYKKLFKNIVNLYKYGNKIGLEVTGHWEKPFKNILGRNPIAACLPLSGKAVTIDTLGRIKPCIYSNEAILTGKLENIFNKKNYLNFLRKTWIGNIKECKNCILEGFCLGGCYLSRVTGDSKVFEYRCLLFKDMTKFLIREWLKNNYNKIKKRLK